jgi:drug/metabolite transporter (DMT)-like permease
LQNSASRSASRKVAGLASGAATSATSVLSIGAKPSLAAASAYHFLMPPLGMLFAFLVLGEHVESRDLLGIIPVALGIYLVTRPSAAAKPLP